MPAAWLRRNVFHPCEGGPLLRAIYLATLVWPISMPSLRSSPWILGAPHNGLAMLISRISRRISNGAAGRPQRCRDFKRQYDLKPVRCQRMTVSGFTIVSALGFGELARNPFSRWVRGHSQPPDLAPIVMQYQQPIEQSE